MEADLERLRKDRGEGEPVKLVESVEVKGDRGKGAVATGQSIEIRLGGGGESESDSDDVPGGAMDEGQGTHRDQSHDNNALVMWSTTIVYLQKH